MKPRIKAKFLVAAGLLLCAFFSFAGGVYANGNTSADAPAPAPEPEIKKSVRRAPIKRPAKPEKKPVKKPVVRKKTPPKPAQPSSLERGIALMDFERYEQARRWLQKAVQEERRNPYAWYWYGLCHERTGQFSQAQFFYTKALELDPAFPPLSRIVTYPNDGERVPLWDPLRPARVYPVETDTRGITIVPPDAPDATLRPARPPIDPDLPKVPVYIPPEPSAMWVSGDALQPPVYVPPRAETD